MINLFLNEENMIFIKIYVPFFLISDDSFTLTDFVNIFLDFMRSINILNLKRQMVDDFSKKINTLYA